MSRAINVLSVCLALTLLPVAAGTASAKPIKTKATAKKAKKIDFGVHDVEGGRQVPVGDQFVVRGAAKHGSLIRIRQHFFTELVRSAENL